MKRRISIALAGLLLVAAGLACETGEILTSEEATLRAQATRDPGVTAGGAEPQSPPAEGDESGIQVGDSVYLSAEGFLVSFYSEAGGTRIVTAQERGALVTVLAIEDVEGTTWYRLEAPAGTGWVPEDKITTEGPGS